MILLLDNYDSFSYNLYQLIGSLDPDIRVIRNDDMTVDEIRALHPQAIVISPGPGKPDSGRLSGTPGHLCGIRRNRVLCQDPHAREAVHGHRGHPLPAVSGLPGNHAGGKVSFPGSDGEHAAGLPGGHREGGRRRDHVGEA